MPDMLVHVTDEQIEKLATTALLELFTPENREKMVKEAVRTLLHENDRYDKKPHIKVIFEDTVKRFVRNYCEELIENDTEIRKQLQEIVVDGFKKMCSDEEDREKLASKLGKDIFHSLMYGR